jgi:ABC-2 type transport system permease protein
VLLLAVRDSYGCRELLAEMLDIVSGAIFPLTVLPGAVRVLAEFLPLSYWLELVRRSLLGEGTVKLYPALSDAAVVGRLALTTAALAVVGQVVYVVADRRARRFGFIDIEAVLSCSLPAGPAFDRPPRRRRGSAGRPGPDVSDHGTV